ncbi:MAG: hypothetical protein K8R90_11935 [Candidatus Cloacimonetes bacterium]|nr:hypothetical protein [Candidatus Cloacimonadota bacterium]
MRILIAVCLLVIITPCIAVSRGAALFLQLNTSAYESAFGRRAGAANIWNIGPVECLNNPAKLGYVGEGASWGFSHSNWMDFSDIGLSSSYVAYSWNGIGIMLPSLNADGHWGKSLDYGEMSATGEQGQELGTINPYESGSTFGVGVNLLQFLANVRQDRHLGDFSKIYELSIGYQYTYVITDWDRDGVFPDAQEADGAHVNNLGLLARWTPLGDTPDSDEPLEFEFTGAYFTLNPFDSEVKYSEGQDWPIVSAEYISFAAQLRVPNRLGILPDYCQNLISATAMADMCDEDSYNTSTSGWGVTLLDILSFRFGDEWGWGVNLNYRDIVQCQYNWAQIDAGELTDHNELWDISVRVNLLELL